MAFARENGINLLDVTGLMKLISLRTPRTAGSLLAVALEGEYWRPTCVNCGTKLVERTPRNGGAKFWGCPHLSQVQDDDADALRRGLIGLHGRAVKQGFGRGAV